MSYLDELGDRIKQFRKAAGMTQQELAEAVGMTRSSIANMEAARQEPSLQTTARMARVLGVTWATLIGDLDKLLDPLPWAELARRVTASEREYRDLADQCWWGLDVTKALRYRGMADGLGLAREHHLAVVAGQPPSLPDETNNHEETARS